MNCSIYQVPLLSSDYPNCCTKWLDTSEKTIVFTISDWHPKSAAVRTLDEPKSTGWPRLRFWITPLPSLIGLAPHESFQPARLLDGPTCRMRYGSGASDWSGGNAIWTLFSQGGSRPRAWWDQKSVPKVDWWADGEQKGSSLKVNRFTLSNTAKQRLKKGKRAQSLF